ncbi:hypothetical protein [Streptomyces luteireticuli]|uniref:hypothetical protein n=1 Tax=Streptomyces luteireticuli TaxID=173858 RepID=UPI0035588697
MSSPPCAVRRRAVVRAIVAAGVCAAMVSSCDSGSDGRDDARAAADSAAAASAAPGADTLMIIRHAEKPREKDDGKKPPFGVTEDGEQNEHALVVRGWQRAGALTGLFAPDGGASPRPGLRRPSAVYAADGHDGGKGLRPAETVAPLAAKLGLRVNTDYGQGDESALVKEVSGRHGATLVSWEHHRISHIVKKLGTVRPAPPDAWPDDRFDLVWVFTREGKGWRFQQVPQLLLAGDRSDPA